MFSARSCSPLEMKILVPLIAYEPSPFGSAFVRRMPRSVPQCGSVRHIVPVHSPDTSLGRYACCSSGVPCACRHSYAPCDRPGYIVHAWFAEFIISYSALLTNAGKPWPPKSGSQPSAGQPASTYWRYASLKPFGVVTTPSPSYLQPSWSPLWFSGNSTSEQNLPASSSTWLIVSASRSACFGICLISASTFSSSCNTNCMSRNGAAYCPMSLSNQSKGVGSSSTASLPRRLDPSDKDPPSLASGLRSRSDTKQSVFPARPMSG